MGVPSEKGVLDLKETMNGKFYLITMSNTESFVLGKQNPLERALNKVNVLNTWKNQLIKFVYGFRVFKYALWQKMKTQKCWKSTESFPSQKNTQY